MSGYLGVCRKAACAFRVSSALKFIFCTQCYDTDTTIPVRDSVIGTLSSAMFAGMMFGAVGWGTCSDLMGRTTAFNATLFLTAFFGVFASFAPTFIWLCLSLFFLGSAVGVCLVLDPRDSL